MEKQATTAPPDPTTATATAPPPPHDDGPAPHWLDVDPATGDAELIRRKDVARAAYAAYLAAPTAQNKEALLGHTDDFINRAGELRLQALREERFPWFGARYYMYTWFGATEVVHVLDILLVIVRFVNMLLAVYFAFAAGQWEA